MNKKNTKKSTRREYGSGSISVNNKINRYTVTWAGSNGKRHSSSRFELTPKGKKEAIQFLSEINSMKTEGIDVDEQAPLYKWLGQFLLYKKNNVKRTTLERYKDTLLMITDNLMEKPINNITESDLRTLYNRLSISYKASTIHELHSVLLGTFTLATKERKIKYNIMLNIKRPRKKQEDIEILTPREIGKIFRYTRKQIKEKETYLLLFRILAGTGMRIGEVLALQWKDINFTTEEIHVHKTVWQDGSLEETKTKAGNRLIPILSEKTLKMLKKAKGKNQERIFQYKDKPLKYENVKYIWDKINEATNINKKLHNWRHTWASNMLKRGWPIAEVSRILGHSDPSITMRIYTHSIPNSNQRLINEYRSSIKRKK